MTPYATYSLLSIVITVVFMILVVSLLSRCSLYLSKILNELKNSDKRPFTFKGQ